MSINAVSSPSASDGASQQALARQFQQRARASNSETADAQASDAQSEMNRTTSEIATGPTLFDKDDTNARTQWA